MRDAETTTMDLGFKPPPRGEDLPHTDGEPMETQRHYEQSHLLVGTLKHHWRGRDDVFVAGNMFVYFSELQVKTNDFRGPDVFVVMDTTNHERKSWVVWEEGGRGPDVVIELLSPSTEKYDRGEKMRIYAKLLHVAELYLFDPWSGLFEGYELDASAREYRRRTPDAQGRHFSRVTGLTLGVQEGRHMAIDAPWLRWFDEAGSVLPTQDEHWALVEQARERASEAERQASEAARRANEAAERADEAVHRASEAADRESQATAESEALKRRVAELEAKLRGR